jgi:hypothetical protein
MITPDDATGAQAALYRGITRGRSPYTEGRGAPLVRRMDELERHTGGRRTAAAREAGVSLRTWERWRRGTQRPKPESESRLARVLRRRRLARGREAWLRGLPQHVYVRGTIVISEDERDRTIDLARTDPPHRPGWLSPLLDYWLAGNDRAAEIELYWLIDRYVPGMFPTFVEEVIFSRVPLNF